MLTTQAMPLSIVTASQNLYSTHAYFYKGDSVKCFGISCRAAVFRGQETTTMTTTNAFIYFNLHKKMFSVRDTKSGLVVGHANEATVRDAVFRVSQAGRERVLRERSKNVHAGVRGTTTMEGGSVKGWTRLTYNPYKYKSFVTAKSERPVAAAQEVRLRSENGRARMYARGITFSE